MTRHRPSPRTLEAPTEAPALIGPALPNIIAADIGATQMRVARGAEQMEDYITLRTPSNYEKILQQLGRATGIILGGQKPDAIGIGYAGRIEDGVIMQAGKLSGSIGRNLIEGVAEHTGAPLKRVAGKNDVEVAAIAEQQAQLRKGRLQDGESQAIFTISTGYGGALFTNSEIIPDEPGHQQISAESLFVCGCGNKGCMEAHFSGSGIERNYGRRGENIPHDDESGIWDRVRTDLAEGTSLTLGRYETDLGMTPHTLHYFGSVALKGPGLLDSLGEHLDLRYGEYAPRIERATYGDESGLYGAYFAAQATLHN